MNGTIHIGYRTFKGSGSAFWVTLNLVMCLAVVVYGISRSEQGFELARHIFDRVAAYYMPLKGPAMNRSDLFSQTDHPHGGGGAEAPRKPFKKPEASPQKARERSNSGPQAREIDPGRTRGEPRGASRAATESKGHATAAKGS